MEKQSESIGQAMKTIWKNIEKAIGKYWKSTGKAIAEHWKITGKATEKQWNELDGNVFETQQNNGKAMENE